MRNPTTWILILALMFIMYLCSQGDNESDTPTQYTPDDMDAYVMAKKLFESRLKAPSTAEFADYSDSKIMNLGGDEWEVSSYVDSQNGFGAMIRTKFTITMTVNRDTKYWQATHLETDP